jgi:hypothetical protein
MLTPKSVETKRLPVWEVEGDVGDWFVAEIVIDIRPRRRMGRGVVMNVEHVPCRRTGSRGVRIITGE